MQYVERTGSPSFFMHLECFRDHPVDYIKDGAHPWKSWQPINHFTHRASQVEGLANYPDAKVFFSSSIASSSGAAAAVGSSLKKEKSSSGTRLVTPETGALGTTTSSILGSKRTRESLSHNSAASQFGQSNSVEGPGSSEPGPVAKRPHILDLVQFKIPSFNDILEECQGDREEADKQFRFHLNIQANREAAYNRARRAQLAADKITSDGQRPEPKSATRCVDESTSKTDSQPGLAKRIQKHAIKENKSELESDSDSDATATDEENESQSTLQWMKPGQLSLQVGVSISVMRRWANSGLVRTLVSAGGHRLFNVASVVDYIEQQATEASVGERNQVSPNDASGSDVVIFVRLPNRAGDLPKSQNLKATLLSNDQSASTRMRDAARHVQQQLRSVFPSSKLIIELPEIPLEDFHHRNSLNRLHAYLRKQQVSKLILCTTHDISQNAVVYALFEWMCAKHNVAIETVPNLYTLS